MEYRQLGKTDLQVSSIGMGSGTFGREIDRDTSHRVMDHALERGITLCDTAEAYANGESERVVGTWLASRGTRDNIVLATKVAGELTRDRVVSSAEDSLRRLNVEAVDLFQAHNWSEDVPLEETLEALRLLVKQGKTRYIGCSNFDASQLDQALKIAGESGSARLESVQPHYNLVDRDIEPELLPLCADQSIGVISYSPLGAGFLTGKYSQGGPIPAGTRFDIMPAHQDVYFSDESFRQMERLRSLAEETGRSMVQLALAWIFGRPGVTSVLVGARSTAHIDQAFEAEAEGLQDGLLEMLQNL